MAATRLAIGASSNIGIYLLQPFVARFASEYGARTAVDLRVSTNPEIAACLSSGEIDIAVMEWWDNRPGFSARAWRREELQEELAAVERAEARLAAGTYGLSVESGDPIPDARLEARPTAERTVEEEDRYRRG